MTGAASGIKTNLHAPLVTPQTNARTDDLVLETNGLYVGFNVGGKSVEAVADLSYKVCAGKTLAIVGGSGAGKTASCRALMGLLPEKATVSGSAVFMGTQLLGLPEREMRAHRGRLIAMAFQDASRALNPTMRIGRQVCESICAHDHHDWKTARQYAIELLEILKIPAPRERLEAYPHQLSGGMRQRVMLAIAIAAKPKLLIADEPTSSLDSVTRVLLIELLKDLQKRFDMALILVSHDLHTAAELADDILVMQSGRAIEYGPANDVLSSPRMEYSKALLENLRASRLATTETPQVLSSRTRRTDAPGAQFELEARSIAKEYQLHGAVVHALSDVSFGIRNTEVVGLVGETGSGKTTLASILLGLQQPTFGSVLFRGRDMTNRRDPRNRYIQAIFQDPFGSLNPKWRVAKIIGEPLVGYGIGDRKSRRLRVLEVLDLVNLSPTIAQRRPRQLSGGEVQRVAIARALACDPAVLVCDEALSSLDAITQREILSLLRSYGLACLFISHDLSVVQQFCDRTAVLHLGQLCEIGPTNVLCRKPSHPYTRTLVNARVHLRKRDSPAEQDRSYLSTVDAPSPMTPPSGCRFRTRCARATALCADNTPQLRLVGHDHLVACHFPLVSETHSGG